jgi:RNA polymerase sigma-70 factor, ECF subfamily
LRIELHHNNDEAGLVKRCREQDAEAQKTLYMAYADRMMMLCLRYIPNREDAKETMMDGFLNFYRNIGAFEYRGEGSVQAWLKKIMVNQCLMLLRKKRPVWVEHQENESDPYGVQHDDTYWRMSVKEIMNMIHALPDGCRTIFNLYVFEGLGHTEIAMLLDISESTSKSQLHRARTLLKEKILQTC